MFETDDPFITLERWLADFETLPSTDEVRPKMLFQNANRLLGLSVTRAERRV